jgi:hypothetical protein
MWPSSDMQLKSSPNWNFNWCSIMCYRRVISGYFPSNYRALTWFCRIANTSTGNKWWKKCAENGTNMSDQMHNFCTFSSLSLHILTSRCNIASLTIILFCIFIEAIQRAISVLNLQYKIQHLSNNATGVIKNILTILYQIYFEFWWKTSDLSFCIDIDRYQKANK